MKTLKVFSANKIATKLLFQVPLKKQTQHFTSDLLKKAFCLFVFVLLFFTNNGLCVGVCVGCAGGVGVCVGGWVGCMGVCVCVCGRKVSYYESNWLHLPVHLFMPLPNNTTINCLCYISALLKNEVHMFKFIDFFTSCYPFSRQHYLDMIIAIGLYFEEKKNKKCTSFANSVSCFFIFLFITRPKSNHLIRVWKSNYNIFWDATTRSHLVNL